MSSAMTNWFPCGKIDSKMSAENASNVIDLTPGYRFARLVAAVRVNESAKIFLIDNPAVLINQSILAWIVYVLPEPAPADKIE